MRASQRGNALFRAGIQPLRQPRAPTSRHPPLEIEPSRRVTQRRYSSSRHREDEHCSCHMSAQVVSACTRASVAGK